MEDNTVVIPATNPETVTPTVEVPTKMLTQEQVDVIIRDRLAKQKEQIYKNIGFENSDALKKKLGEYETVLKEHELTKKELEAFKTEKAKKELTDKVTASGVDPDFVDFVLSKVEINDQFDENLKAFVEANPKIKVENFKQVNSNLPLGGQGQKDPSQMSMTEFAEWRKNSKK